MESREFRLEAPVKVYNFNVEDYHTYYVSEYGILVHNVCGDIGPYKSLTKAEKGSGNEVHHIIEKRFQRLTVYQNPNDMMGVTLEKSEHRHFTNLWRGELKYGANHQKDAVIKAAKKIYANYPELLEIALKEFAP